MFTERNVCEDIMKYVSHLPSLTEAQHVELVAPITPFELSGALTEMLSGKIPGIDGLPAEFFMAFFGTF